MARFGTLDILVHAAGVFLPTPFVETPDSELDAQLAVNVRAPFRLTRSAATHLSDGSAVIFVSSICGYVGFPNSSAYCATKGAVELLVKSLSAEFRAQGNPCQCRSSRQRANEYQCSSPRRQGIREADARLDPCRPRRRGGRYRACGRLLGLAGGLIHPRIEPADRRRLGCLLGTPTDLPLNLIQQGPDPALTEE